MIGYNKGVLEVKKIILEVLSFILIIGALLYLNMFMIMYNIQVKSATDTDIMLSVFGQDFYYEYEKEFFKFLFFFHKTIDIFEIICYNIIRK